MHLLNEQSLHNPLCCLPGSVQVGFRAGVSALSLARWQPHMLACLPTLTSLSLPRCKDLNKHIQTLASASCASTLRKVDLQGSSDGSACEANTALQQLGSLAAPQDLKLVIEFGGAISDAPCLTLDVGPLGALSQLQSLHLGIHGCSLDASSLHALAAGCTRLSKLQLALTPDKCVTSGARQPAAQPTCTWPSLQRLHLHGMQPSEAAAVLAAAFHSCPSLNSMEVHLDMLAFAGSAASALQELCQRLAALPGKVECLSMAWPACKGFVQQLTTARALSVALAPLKGRIACLRLGGVVVKQGMWQRWRQPWGRSCGGFISCAACAWLVL